MASHSQETPGEGQDSPAVKTKQKKIRVARIWRATLGRQRGRGKYLAVKSKTIFSEWPGGGQPLSVDSGGEARLSGNKNKKTYCQSGQNVASHSWQTAGEGQNSPAVKTKIYFLSGQDGASHSW